MKKIIITFFGSSIFFLGIFIGIIIENIRQSDQKIFNFSSVEISEKNTPVLLLKNIENGILSGKIQNSKNSDIRIFLEKKSGEKEISILSSGFFSIDISEILPMLKKIPAPKGKNFVASNRGKKCYTLDNPRAFLITPKNRIFFETLKEAEKKGFKKY